MNFLRESFSLSWIYGPWILFGVQYSSNAIFNYYQTEYRIWVWIRDEPKYQTTTDLTNQLMNDKKIALNILE